MTGNNTNQTPHEKTSTEDTSKNTQTDTDSSVQVSDLNEETNSQLIKKLVTRMDALEKENETLRSLYKELDKRVSVLESRADHLNDGIESTEIEMRQNKDDIERKHGELKDRITAIEAELGIEDWDSESILTKPSCELERLSQMPDKMRDDELSRSVNRAIIIWNHFEQWSQPVANGQLLPSSEIRKLLSTRLNAKLEWVQVYRVMESFSKNTPDQYEIIETQNSGKSIIRHYEE
jgi:ribosome-binding ATPase YchF (GTP1/OBG family)